MANEMIQKEATAYAHTYYFSCTATNRFYLFRELGMKLTRIFTYNDYINHKKRLNLQVYTYYNEFLAEILLFIIQLNP